MFNIIRMGCGCRHDPNFVFDRPGGLEDTLMLFVRTRAQFVIGGERIITEPDTFFIFEPHTPLCYGSYEGEYENDWIRFSNPEPLAAPDISGKPVPICGKVDVSQYFRLIGDCYFRNGSRQTEMLLIKALLNEVYSLGGEKYSSIAHYRELLELRGRIYAAPQEEWSIANMAKLVCISEPYLYRLYKKAFGVTCNADVINSRIEQASHYLAYSDLGIEETAFLCGYKNAVHFSRQFKQAMGQSPKEWREQNRSI